MTAHQPLARSWVCAGCLLPWPCPARQAQLLAYYGGSISCLALVMSSAFVEAASDLRDVPAGQLLDQFLGWLEARP